MSEASGGGPHERTVGPVRVQLRRTKGWRMPPNTVKVDRTTKWGNPFAVGKPGPGGFVAQDRRHAVKLYEGFAPLNDKLIAAARSELAGKNLACWCPRDDPYYDCCHAAVLLRLANDERPNAGIQRPRSGPLEWLVRRDAPGG